METKVYRRSKKIELKMSEEIIDSLSWSWHRFGMSSGVWDRRIHLLAYRR